MSSLSQYAAGLIKRRLRSERQVRELLKKREATETEIDEIITELMRIGLVDDARFARAYVNDHIRFSTHSLYRTKRELEQLGVSSSQIKEAVDEVDEADMQAWIERIRLKVNRKSQRLSHLSEWEVSQRLKGELARQGFTQEEQRRILDV